MNIEQIVRDSIADVIHMSLATSVNDVPWITEVHYSYDEDLNFYFLSRPSRRHSEDIASNKLVAGNIVKQHTKGEKVRGVYFEGICEQLENVQIDHAAYVTYRDRLSIGPERIEEQKEDDGHKFYMVSVKTFYLFDEIEASPAGKYELKWK